MSGTDLGVEAKIDDEIKVAVGIGDQVRYRDEGVRVQIVAMKEKDASENSLGAVLETADFSSLRSLTRQAIRCVPL